MLNKSRQMGLPVETRAKLERSLQQAVSWVQAHQYRGYEPADGNLSWLFSLTGGRVLPMRVLQQVVLRSPWNVRPLLGVRPHESAIGRGYMAWGYLAMHRENGGEAACREALLCLDWLMANRSPHAKEYCWGDPYEYATRGGRRPYMQPLLIWSALIGQVFLDAYSMFEEEKYLRVAESTGKWILNLPKESTDRGSCLSYIAYRQSSIHNSNAMGAAFLARLGSLTKNGDALTAARAAMTYTCVRQREDGSWFYGEEPKYHWIDSFHTGYNLSALESYRTAAQDTSFDDCLVKGLHFYRTHFFETNGRPKYFHNQTYPVDIQCAAQAIETLVTLSERDAQAAPLARIVAEWTIDHMQAPDGHFYYRDLGWTKVKTPMLHWGQGTMVKALALFLEKSALCIHQVQGSAIA